MIADNEARYIAAQWASGGDEMQVLASTGAIVPGALELAEANWHYAGGNSNYGPADIEELENLVAYISVYGPRVEVPGWGDMPECDIERESRLIWEEQHANYNAMVSEGLSRVSGY